MLTNPLEYSYPHIREDIMLSRRGTKGHCAGKTRVGMHDNFLLHIFVKIFFVLKKHISLHLFMKNVLLSLHIAHDNLILCHIREVD